MAECDANELERAKDLLDTVDHALGELADVAWWRVAETELMSMTQHLERLCRRMLVPQLSLAAELDARGVADRHGFRTTGALLSNLLTISTSEAVGRVRAAALVRPRDDGWPTELPLVATALQQGGLGEDQLRIITATMTTLPMSVDPETRTLCEKTLVHEAQYRPAPKLATVAEQIRCITDPDGADRTEDRAGQVDLTIGATRTNGLTPFRGLLDSVGLETLRQALEPLAAPRPAENGDRDPRTAATRRGQALVELARRWLGVGENPRQRGVRPHATIICTLEQLRGGVGAGLLEYAGPAGQAVTRLLTCDAQATLLAVDQQGRILDGTGEFRFFSSGQRKALAVRDGGCAFPGCDIPAAWTDAHHIKHWADGGPTVLDNGVLLCGYHHGFMHRSHCGWTVHLDPDDRKPWFVPPPWLDPERRPRRNRLPELRVVLPPPDPAPVRSSVRSGAEPW